MNDLFSWSVDSSTVRFTPYTPIGMSALNGVTFSIIVGRFMGVVLGTLRLELVDIVVNFPYK